MILLKNLTNSGTFTPQRVFLFTAIIWGSLTVFITPPFQVPDEPNHFLRAFQIASGDLLPENQNNRVGGFVPSSLEKTILLFINIPFHPDQKMTYEKIHLSLQYSLTAEKKSFVSFPNTSTYAPVLYLPQSLAVFIFKIFNTPPIILMYAARLFNLFSWIILVFLALSLVPVYKWLFMLLALTPMSVFQASSLSVDAITNGVAFLFISMIFRLAFDKNVRFKKTDFFYLSILLMFLTLSRYAYCFLYVLFFLIPPGKSGSRQKYMLAAFGLFLIICCTLFTGGYYVKHIYDSVDIAVNFYGDNQKIIQPYLQIQFIFTHAIYYLKTILVTFWTNNLFIPSFIGNLGWLDTPLPNIYIGCSILTLLAVSMCDSNKNVNISIINKLIIFTSIISVIFIICLLLYLSWTPVGSPTIDGIQGRYFIPVAPLIFSLFYNRNLNLPVNTIKIISLIYIAISFVVMNHALISRYYFSLPGPF